jgi:lipopolysaccharide/colanic/teichoic acid biosynthesis glycosyltransferase
VKRVFDLTLAITALVLLAPLFAVIMIAVLVTDGWPVFFGQKRVGQHGVPFIMWKFRTMVVGSDRRGNRLTIGSDPRVTRLGYWLRKFKIDELPQFWNVVRGEMSLVGPRPEVPEYVDRYTAQQREVLKLKPGITDVASIRFRHEGELLGTANDPHETYVRQIMPLKISLNLEYARSASVLSDLRVMAKTATSLLE